MLDVYQRTENGNVFAVWFTFDLFVVCFIALICVQAQIFAGKNKQN